MSEVFSPKVSVVIPVRNGLPWIEATLRSVLKQTLPAENIEVVVVDDGSTDGTVEFCNALMQDWPVPFTVVSQPGNGVSAARNKGIEIARAEWIKLLDADDLLDPKILEEEVAIALATPTDVAVVASPWCRFSEDSAGMKILGKLNSPSFSDWATLNLLHADGFVPVGSYILRKTWWNYSGGFSERRAHVEDVEFLLRVTDAGGRFTNTVANSPLFYYRTRGDSVSMRSQPKILEGSILNAQAVEARAVESGRMCVALKAVLLDVYSQGLRYWFIHDRSKFDDLYRHVKTLEPHYIPSGPPMLSHLSRALGYPVAEHVAQLYRCGKRFVQGITSPRSGTTE